jgi:hypothetical protein
MLQLLFLFSLLLSWGQLFESYSRQALPPWFTALQYADINGVTGPMGCSAAQFRAHFLRHPGADCSVCWLACGTVQTNNRLAPSSSLNPPRGIGPALWSQACIP